MTVYLGDAGWLEFTRESVGNSFVSLMEPSDVVADNNRFSFDFPPQMLISGDLLSIATTDGSPLSFIDGSAWDNGQVADQGSWFCHVDMVGGVFLYPEFAQAINGEEDGMVMLQPLNRTLELTVRVLQGTTRCLAKVTRYELNTSREAVDVTSLSEGFRNQFSNLISGSGSVDCFFEYEKDPCDPDTSDDSEVASYLHQLILRTNLGAEFSAKLFIIGRGGNFDDPDDQLWFEFQAIVTNGVIGLAPSEAIRSRFDFVTTGRVRMRLKAISKYITQENTGLIKLERRQGSGALEHENDIRFAVGPREADLS